MGPTLKTGVEIRAGVFFLKNSLALWWLKIKIKYSFLNYDKKKTIFYSDLHLKTSCSDFSSHILHWGCTDAKYILLKRNKLCIETFSSSRSWTPARSLRYTPASSPCIQALFVDNGGGIHIESLNLTTVCRFHGHANISH